MDSKADVKNIGTNELRHETTLAAIAVDPEADSHFLLFGVIVDVSEPSKVEKLSNYVTKLKIVDPSLNYKVKVDGTKLRFFKFCHVLIYSETPESAPKVKWIGEIIRLRRFKYTISFTKNELLAVEIMKYSNWIIYSGLKESSMKPISYKSNMPKNVNRQTTFYEEGRITDLRDWAFEFFSRSTMRYIIWWNSILQQEKLNVDNKFPQTYKNVDLILKIVDVNNSDKKMTFIDEEGIKYTLILPTKPQETRNQIVKLRCVDVVHNIVKKVTTRVIKPTEKTSCLYLHPHFRDTIGFDQERKTLVGKNYYKLEFTQTQSKDFITDIKKFYLGIVPTSAERLAHYIKDEPDLHINERFVFEGKIAQFSSLNPNDIIKKQESKFSNVFSLKEKKDKKYQIIYYLTMTLTDSNSSSNKFIAHIISSEENYYIFDEFGILPPTKDNVSWNAIKDSTLTQFTNKLENIQKKSLKVRFVLQLTMTSSNKPFYKIVDTMFKNF